MAFLDRQTSRSIRHTLIEGARLDDVVGTAVREVFFGLTSHPEGWQWTVKSLDPRSSPTLLQEAGAVARGTVPPSSGWHRVHDRASRTDQCAELLLFRHPIAPGLWLGTLSGIARFDGFESRTYLDDPAEPTAALTNWSSKMIEDPEGVLWVATAGGLKRLTAVPVGLPSTGMIRLTYPRFPGFISAPCLDAMAPSGSARSRGMVARLHRSTSKFSHARGSRCGARAYPPSSHRRITPGHSGRMRRRRSSHTIR
jgi:hypothetical protein